MAQKFDLIQVIKGQSRWKYIANDTPSSPTIENCKVSFVAVVSPPSLLRDTKVTKSHEELFGWGGPPLCSARGQWPSDDGGKRGGIGREWNSVATSLEPRGGWRGTECVGDLKCGNGQKSASPDIF